MRYRFSPFELDDETLTLRKHGGPVGIRPQALDVLLHLVRCRDRFVTRGELVEHVWAGAAVSETAVPQAVLAARRAIDDGGDDGTAIQTIRGRGYRFIATVETGDEAPAPGSGLAGHFVGRDACIRRFDAALARADERHGDVILLIGASGYGKSRALRELSARARSTGARTLEIAARADAAELSIWVEVLAEIGASGAEKLLRDTSQDRSPVRGGIEVVDRVGELVRAASPKAALVIAIDDLHLADEASLVFFKLLCDALRHSRVLFLATYPDAALRERPVLSRTVAGMVRQDPSRCVALRPFSLTDVSDLATSLLGSSPSREMLNRVFEKSDGSPLLVTQLLFLLSSEAWTGGNGDAATSAMLSTRTVRQAIGMHLEELSPNCRRAITVASIFGRTCSLGCLALTLETDLTRTLAMVDEALEARVLEKLAASAGMFRFAHALVRDMLYSELSLSDRAKLHERAGRALAESGDETAATEQLSRAAHALGLFPHGSVDTAFSAQDLLARIDEARGR